jgi:leucyl-tRNA synthetase
MYYLQITDYAEELLAYLDKMPGWPERVKTMQANWIGKSDGVRFAFPHDIPRRRPADRRRRMYVFTTRADTIMGVTFCAVAAEHPLALHAAKRIRSSPRSSRNAGAAVIEADLATMEKKGCRPAVVGTHHQRADRGLGRQLCADELRRRRRHGRAGHDERDFAFARNTDCRSSR